MLSRNKSKKYLNLRKEFKNAKKEHFLLKHYFSKKWNLRKIKKNKAPDISTITENIAFVIDGRVVEIIHCQPKLAAILLSNPEIIKVPKNQVIGLNWMYKDNEFIDPHTKSSHGQNGHDHDHEHRH